MKPESSRKILVAGMGTSPAVLTNAVWALAHQKKPVVPDEIVVITTKSGREVAEMHAFIEERRLVIRAVENLGRTS